VSGKPALPFWSPSPTRWSTAGRWRESGVSATTWTRLAQYGSANPFVGRPNDTVASKRPSVGVVLVMMKRVSSSLAVESELGVHGYQLRAAMDDLGLVDPCFELSHPGLAPVAPECAEADLGGSLERDEGFSASDEWFVDDGEVGAGNKVVAEDVGIDDDRASTRPVAHPSRAARKAAPSSPLRSSITISW